MPRWKECWIIFITVAIPEAIAASCLCGHHHLSAEVTAWGSLQAQLQLPPVLTNSLPFYFTNKHIGTKFWGKQLLAQKGGESSQLPFLLHCPLRKRLFSYLVWNKNFSTPTVCPSFLLSVCASLSDPLTSPHCLCHFQRTGCLFHLLAYGWSSLNNTTLGFKAWSNILQQRSR